MPLGPVGPPQLVAAAGTPSAGAPSAPASITLEPGDPNKKERTIHGAAVLAQLSYENDAETVRSTLKALGFEDVKLYGWDLKGSTQAFVARKGDTVVVSFRGTQERGDIFRDLEATNPEADTKLTGSEVQDYARFEGSKVHRGFRDGLAELWDPDPHGRNGERLAAAGQKSLLSTLQYEADRPDRPNTKFIFTGHSLGGAQATLAAACTSVQNPARSSRTTMANKIAAVITFGSPKVGNEAFVSAYDASIGKVTMPVQHNTDIVRGVPLTSRYQQVMASDTIVFDPADTANPPSAIDSHRMSHYVAASALRAQAEAARAGAATPPAATVHAAAGYSTHDGFA